MRRLERIIYGDVIKVCERSPPLTPSRHPTPTPPLALPNHLPNPLLFSSSRLLALLARSSRSLFLPSPPPPPNPRPLPSSTCSSSPRPRHDPQLRQPDFKLPGSDSDLMTSSSLLIKFTKLHISVNPFQPTLTSLTSGAFASHLQISPLK